MGEGRLIGVDMGFGGIGRLLPLKRFSGGHSSGLLRLQLLSLLHSPVIIVVFVVLVRPKGAIIE